MPRFEDKSIGPSTKYPKDFDDSKYLYVSFTRCTFEPGWDTWLASSYAHRISFFDCEVPASMPRAYRISFIRCTFAPGWLRDGDDAIRWRVLSFLVA